MENISVFLDTDALINWLAKEVDPNTGEELWRAPLRILKEIEIGELSGFTSIINLMEIIFVLRRKKRWKDEKIISTIGRDRLYHLKGFRFYINSEHRRKETSGIYARKILKRCDETKLTSSQSIGAPPSCNFLSHTLSCILFFMGLSVREAILMVCPDMCHQAAFS